MRYSWIALAQLDLVVAESICASSYLRVERNPGFLKPLGVTSPRALRPWLVNPTIEVWQEVQRKLNKETQATARGSSNMLFLRDSIDELEKKYTFVIRFYRPNILCIEINLDYDYPIDIDRGFEKRDLRSHFAACLIVDCLIGIVKMGPLDGGAIRAYSVNNSFSGKTAIFLNSGVPSDEFLAWRDANKNVIVGLLLNNKNYRISDSDLSDKIIGRNKEIDIKYSKTAFSLISKQGVLTAFSPSGDEFLHDMRREHQKRFRFLEYALVIQEFVRNYAALRLQKENVFDFIFYLVSPYMGKNSSLPKTVTGTYVWRLLSDELNLERLLEGVEGPLQRAVEKKTPSFLKINRDDFDSIEYEKIIQSAIDSDKNHWILNIFGNKILDSVVTFIGGIVTIGGAIWAVYKFFVP